MQPPQPQTTQPEPGSRRGASSTCSTAPSRRSSGGIGCVAGLLRLISPYHRSHHRKRLTAKNKASSARDHYSQALQPTPPSSPPRKKAGSAAAQQPSASPAPSPVKPMLQQVMTTTAVTVVRRRRSCDAPRSPTIAPEHRRSSCDSPRPPPPAIIARLMGLEESAPSSPAAATATTTPRPVVLPTRPPPPPPPAAPETAAEKRRKLLGALEKCDEDLKTLRRIIAAVRAAEMRAASASDIVVCPVPATTTPAAAGKGAKRTFGRDEQSPSPSPSPPTQQQQQYPSPDSVLDAISSPRFPCRKRASPCTDLDVGGKGGCGNGALAPTVGSKVVKPSRTLVFSGDYCKIKSGDGELPLHAVHYPAPPLVVGMPPRSAGAESWRHHRRRWEQEAAAAGRVISSATAESVGEAIMWVRHQGQGDDERGKVAAALERAIVQDLVTDLVAELQVQAQQSGGHGTAAGGCRKRLCF